MAVLLPSMAGASQRDCATQKRSRVSTMRMSIYESWTR
jgi:hypothetical protein